MRLELIAPQVVIWGDDLSLGTLWGSQCNWRGGGEVAGRPVQTASLTLSWPFPSAPSFQTCCKPREDVWGEFSLRKGKDKLFDSLCYVAR
jgi:hypothetical protein